jgi:hypothetical protein
MTVCNDFGEDVNYLKDDENIEELVLSLIKDFKAKAKDKNIYGNVLDPFSSMIEASINGLDYDNWIKSETARQHQKTLQNSIGDLHQKLLGNIKDVEDLGVGGVVDIVCRKKKIIAEIKNKHNTTKGNHKVAIYDDISTLLNKPEFKGYTGYYVEIIPKKAKLTNVLFTPPDNTTQTNRPEREDIRKIDGKSFYKLLTDDENALYNMYEKILDILVKNLKLQSNELFIDLLNRAYGSKK